MPQDLTLVLACKNCGAPVTVKLDGLPDNKYGVGRTGSVVSSMCRKCGKNSSFVYSYSKGQLDRIE